MKILFLQKVDNARGGVIQVNINLIKAFIDKGYETVVCSLRHGYTWETIEYPAETLNHVINTKDIWGRPLFTEIVQNLKKGRILKGIHNMLARVLYDYKIHRDYDECKTFIINIRPDIIIVSHYELLSGIPSSYEKKTIMHFHTNFDQVTKNRSYMRYFNKYKDRIFCFVWLSEGTAKRAKEAGLIHSHFIYNPLTFHQEQVSNLKQKTCVFVGRMAPEKRVWLAIQHFIHVTTSFEDAQEWILELYGDGDESKNIQTLIKGHSNIRYNGISNCVKDVFMKSSILLLTSEYEGFPLAVLEAYECGVPVIAYNFGESCKELILHKKNGLLIQQGDNQGYENALANLMKREDERTKMGEYAKEFASLFSIETIVQKWLHLFEEINRQER